MRAEEPGDGERTGQSRRDANGAGESALLENHEEDFAGGGPESHAYSDFASALRDGIGNDAVDASEREEKRGERKNADEGEAETARGERGGVNLREGAESRRKIGIQVVKDGACRRKDGLGIAGGVHDDGEMGNGARTLTIVDVESGERKRLEIVIADIADNTDDGEETKVAINAAVFDGAADGILVGPFFVGNRLGDEGDVGRIEGVAIIKKAATDQWNAEGTEIIRRGYDVVGTVDLGFVVEDVVEERDDVGEQFGIRAKVTGGTSEKILHSRGKLPGFMET